MLAPPQPQQGRPPKRRPHGFCLPQESVPNEPPRYAEKPSREYTRKQRSLLNGHSNKHDSDHYIRKCQDHDSYSLNERSISCALPK